jgi:NADPH2:quinone reductase
MYLIRESYEVKKGDWILVRAAAGGVGLLLCQVSGPFTPLRDNKTP